MSQPPPKTRHRSGPHRQAAANDKPERETSDGAGEEIRGGEGGVRRANAQGSRSVHEGLLVRGIYTGTVAFARAR